MKLYSICPDLVVTSDKRRFRLHGAMRGAWSVVMFHPEAFTPVCSTEIVRLSELRADSGIGLRVFSVVPDKLSRTQSWIAQLNAQTKTGVHHDCIADRDGEMRQAFGFSKEAVAEATLRGYYIFDPELRLRSFTVLPKQIGFSSDEVLRVVTALCLSDSSGDLAPVDWQPGLKMLKVDA